MSLEKYIQDYQLEKIFPRHYFNKLQVRELVAGDAICHQGEALTALSYFAKGKLKIVRRLFNGKEHILDIKEKPTLIGDIELLTDQPIVSSVVALEDTLVIQLPLTGIRKELLADNDLLLNLSRGLAQSLYEQNIHASTNLNYTLKERLATHILAIEDKGVFKLELTNLADSFSVSYRHLLRVIHEFIDLGIIEKRRPNYYIKDMAQLIDLKITN
ncbi:cAMP-binding protein [Streptococcus infantarius subsp. infantarius]|nr:cAMP-binding protein [Streptococcus infantarius subsp. infantarius]